MEIPCFGAHYLSDLRLWLTTWLRLISGDDKFPISITLVTVTMLFGMAAIVSMAMRAGPFH
jgi:hypothetical protein